MYYFYKNKNTCRTAGYGKDLSVRRERFFNYIKLNIIFWVNSYLTKVRWKSEGYLGFGRVWTLGYIFIYLFISRVELVGSDFTIGIVWDVYYSLSPFMWDGKMSQEPHHIPETVDHTEPYNLVSFIFKHLPCTVAVHLSFISIYLFISLYISKTEYTFFTIAWFVYKCIPL